MTVTVFGDNTGDDVAGCEDAYIDQSNATTNYGSNTAYKTQKYGASDHKHHLIRFTGINTTNIPSGDTVTAATYGKYFNNAGGVNSETTTLYRVLQSWVEAQATWTDYATSTAWNTGGAQGSGTDIAASGSGDITYTTSTQEYKTGTLNSTGLTDIKNISTGTYSNNGWLDERTDAEADARYSNFRSNNYSDGLRPYLAVTHSAASTTPYINYYHYLYGGGGVGL